MLQKFIKIGIAGVEVASGVVGTMLNLVDECENENSFCSKLRVFLIYIDLATLGVDALVSRYLKNAADDALRSMPDALRTKHPEIFEELQSVAREGRSTDELKESVKKLLKNSGYTPKFHNVTIDLYDGSGKFIFRLDKNEIGAYLELISIPPSTLKRTLKDINIRLKSSDNAFDSKSAGAIEYGLKSSKMVWHWIF